jgi:putative membrane protein insertion efficiency factor
MLFKIRYIPIGMIGLYQRVVSPLFRPACRFYPTCSEYARLAIEKHGILKGMLKSVIRISKCHPFHPGGYDPVD